MTKMNAQKTRPYVAVKRLRSVDKREFDKEVSILNSIGTRSHAHLIQLLGTYKWGEKYHLLFPYAEANLRQFWERRQMTVWCRETVLWSLEQMSGIASGLNVIHNFRTTIPLDAASPMRVQRGTVSSLLSVNIARDEEKFGRHGDIKPTNILWFPGQPTPSGILRIADFGLGRFHRRETRSNVDPATVTGSPTYEPPDCMLRVAISRAYDMWSLGCLYLVFLTWLLEGHEGTVRFSDQRGELNSNGVSDDNFYTIRTLPNGSIEGSIREGVTDWIAYLRKRPRCSRFVHELLTLISEHLLVIKSGERINALGLVSTFKEMLRKANKDEYLIEPVVPRPVGRTSLSAPVLRTQSLVDDNENASFVRRTSRNQGSITTPTVIVSAPDGDPVSRTNLTPSPTW